jgi:galactokinase
MKTFENYFAAKPAVTASAPGRVNLLGEHTDYNDGFVLPTAIPAQTHVALAKNEDKHHHCYAANLDETARFGQQEQAPEGFARYIEGCIRLIEQRGVAVPPLKIYVSSDVPMGSGLSSSAALEVAMLRALRSLLELRIDDVEIALIAQQAEIHYAHVNCGVMDQMASSLADIEHMLFLDTRTLERRLLPLPEATELIVIDTGVPRTLAGSKYNERRTECEEAARLLNVPALRDVSDLNLVERLPRPLQERARHVVSENLRVLEAAKHGITAERFGILMNDSHASLRDDYLVSIPALDRVVALLQEQPAVFGARMTGAGFGGACVALCRTGEAAVIASEVLSKYNQGKERGSILLPKLS